MRRKEERRKGEESVQGSRRGEERWGRRGEKKREKDKTSFQKTSKHRKT